MELFDKIYVYISKAIIPEEAISMKRTIIFVLLMALTLCGCNMGSQQSVQTSDQPMKETAQAPAQKKVLLELKQFDMDEPSYEGEEAETAEVSVLLGNLSLPETSLKSYENDDYLASIAAVLQDKLGLRLDGRWKFYIHYYTPEQDVGILSITYWVDGIIATNRAVTIPIENGIARTVIYSYLNDPLDEQTLLDKYEQFRDTHEQERSNVLGEAFEIDGESILCSYNFRTDSLKYTYNIFYRHMETGIIDNSYGTEMVIE